MSDADLAAALLKNTGLDTIDLEGDGNTDNMAVATAFVQSHASNRVGAMLDLTVELLKLQSGTDAVAGVAKAFKAKIDGGYAYAINEANTVIQYYSQAREFALSDGKDVLTGSALNDFFKAHIQHNDNTLQSGDVLDGGAGRDVLYADIGNSQNFAITPETRSIEDVKIRSQALGQDSSDGNLNARDVKIDAQRMKDVLNWENIDSRADLVIEDVRINDNQITKDITITMRDTQQGHVDYGVYFDQNSLRNFTNADSQINLRVLDTHNTNLLGSPSLKDSPYGKFVFYAKETGSPAPFAQITFESQEMQDAQTLGEMVAAMQKLADAQFGPGAVGVELGAIYNVVDSVSGRNVQGREIVIKAHGNITFNTTLADSGWWSNGVVPPVSGLYTDYNTAVQVDTQLVTSKVVLDYVGRSSNGGDLVIGGTSIGDTSTSKGVQRFEIEVQDDSRLQTISSTNNTLREVSIVNGETDRVADAHTTKEEGAGLLRVNGQVPGAAAVAAQLPGGSTSLYGFQDVRLIDGSAMKGKLEFTAELTDAAREKYLKLKDVQPDPLAENVKVAYSGGANGDKMVVDIDATLTASRSTVKVGMADFTFDFNGNAGNDEINVAIDRNSVASTREGAEHTLKDVTKFDTILAGDLNILRGNTEAWYHNHRNNDNVRIDAGEGNDVIKTPGVGDFFIFAGTGSDTVYADNTGADQVNIGGAPVRSKAAWVFNTDNQNLPADATQQLGNLQSEEVRTVASYGVEVRVNYRGLLSNRIAIDDKADYQATQLDINQAIKKAINDDAVLSKLLQAEDGPHGTLVVLSKVDGVHNDVALDVQFFDPPLASLTNEVVAGYNAANGLALANAAAVLADIQAKVTANAPGSLAFEGYLNTRMGLDDAMANVDGDISITTSDNLIFPGVDNDVDVIVLGTTSDGVTELGSSNDVVAFQGVFGRDVIVNFNAGALAVGGDQVDFTRVGGRGTLLQAWKPVIAVEAAAVDGQIERVAYTNAGPLRNDSVEAVKALYQATDNVVRAAAATEIYVAVDAARVGHVYQVIDGTAAGDLQVNFLGQLTIAGDPTVATAFDWTVAVGGNFAG
ncbi:MAG: hypothetical protein Q4A11_04510 [Brachymonas sp.]|nr:hypothetical protein [Brachymonas sp.]